MYLKNEFLESYILTDIPGFGANEDDTWSAKKVLPEIDYVILVAPNDTAMGANSASFRDFHELQKHNIPYYFILNCTNKNRWRCDDYGNVNIAETNLNILESYKPLNYPLEENGINIVNFMWYWYSICDNGNELINRRDNKISFDDYGINSHVKDSVGEASNFKLINRIFDMDNRAFLELRREMKEEIERLKKEVCPVGTIQVFSYNTIPEGWLLCDGRFLQINEHPDLFRVIGFTYTYGGDKKDFFQLPDLRGRFIRGWDRDGYNDEKRDFGSKQEDALQNHGHKSVFTENLTSDNGSHSHTIKYEEESYGYGGMFSSTYHMKRITDTDYLKSYVHGMSACLSSGSHTHTLPQIKTEEIEDLKESKVRFSDETRPKNIAMLYCIKCT